MIRKQENTRENKRINENIHGFQRREVQEFESFDAKMLALIY